MEPIRILIVEDEEAIAMMYKIRFEKEGYVVKISTNGINAVTDVTDFFPNIILLDIMMPSMDGFETLKVIRQLAPSLKTKIIMFSNLNNQANVDKAFSLGADAYLLKANTTPKEALNKIQELLGIRPEGAILESKEAFCVCPHCNNVVKIQLSK